MAATSCWPLAYIERAVASFSAVQTVGRPPVRPRARAAASPAAVRSRIRSRSNSARAPKTWKTSRPPGVLGVDGLAQGRQGDPAAVQVGHHVDQVPQRPAEPVQPPHHHGVAGAQLSEQLVQGRAGLQRSRRLVREDAVDAGSLQGVELEALVLLEGADPGIAEAHTALLSRSTHRSPSFSRR